MSRVEEDSKEAESDAVEQPSAIQQKPKHSSSNQNIANLDTAAEYKAVEVTSVKSGEAPFTSSSFKDEPEQQPRAGAGLPTQDSSPSSNNVSSSDAPVKGGLKERKERKDSVKETDTKKGKATGKWQDNKYITQPLYDLIDEVFDLNERGFIRRQATWLLMQIVEVSMDSKVSNAINEQVNYLTSEDMIVTVLDLIWKSVWPGGELFKPAELYTPEEAAKVTEEARQVFHTLCPGSVKTLLGKSSSKKGMDRVFLFLNIEPLVLHLTYTTLDALILQLFPDLRRMLKLE